MVERKLCGCFVSAACCVAVRSSAYTTDELLEVVHCVACGCCWCLLRVPRGVRPGTKDNAVNHAHFAALAFFALFSLDNRLEIFFVVLCDVALCEVCECGSVRVYGMKVVLVFVAQKCP